MSEFTATHRTKRDVEVMVKREGCSCWEVLTRLEYDAGHTAIFCTRSGLEALFEPLPTGIIVEFDLELARRLADCFIPATPFRAMIDARIEAALKKTNEEDAKR